MTIPRSFVPDSSARWLVLLISCCTGFLPAPAQPPTSLRVLVEQSLTNYPTLRARQLQADAARQQSAVVRAGYLPALDASYQANLATFNNLTGMFFPTGLLPISGPPSTTNVFQPVTGSAAAVLGTWTAGTFGQRAARLAEADAELRLRLAETDDERLRHGVLVAQTYLEGVLATERVRLADANRQRTEELLGQVRLLVRDGLRPDVDTALVRTEVSRARVDAATAEAERQRTLLRLAELTAGTPVARIDTLYLSRLPAETPPDTVRTHPAEAVARRQTDLESARGVALGREFRPRLTLWGTTYARGSGVDYLGEVAPLEGLVFSRFNYGLGAQLVVPLLKGTERAALVRQQGFRTQASAERLAQTRLTLDQQRQSAAVIARQARQVAAELPGQVADARQALAALRIRYANGLVSLTDVIGAQYALIRAETEQKTATLNVWKARLLEAFAAGDLNVFLNAR